VIAGIVLALNLIILHDPRGNEIRVNPEDISSLRSAKGQGHYASGLHCLLHMTNGRFVAVAETCAKVERLAKIKITRVHDQWADGSNVPPWVKAVCCGPRDVHRLFPWQVSEVVGGWKVDGLDNVVPRDRVFASEDGYVWAFFNPDVGPRAVVTCLFVRFGF